MGRIRTIKPELPQSERLGTVSRDARLTLILLLTLADDAGRTRGAFRLLSSLLFPYDDDAPAKIESWLRELDRIGSIVLYEVNGDRFVQITNWSKHQKIDRMGESRIPEFDEYSTSARRVFDESSTSPRRVLDESSTTDLGSRTMDLGSVPRTEDLGTRTMDPVPSTEDREPEKPSANRSKKFSPHSLELPTELRTVEFVQAWGDWIDYRQSIKAKSLQPASWKTQIETLARWGPHNAAESIRESIRQGWQGLFEPKGKQVVAKPGQVIAGSTLHEWGKDDD